MPLRSIILAAAIASVACHQRPPAPRPVRVAVIGGIVMTGLWEEISRAVRADTGLEVVLVATGPKEVIIPAFRNGDIDVITLHSSDEATALVADGYGANMRPWTWNEQIIAGPASDPAKIRGLRDGAAALRQIAATQSPYIDARGGGKRLVAEKLWKIAGVQPTGEWVIKDESRSPADLLEFARRHGAYVICGRLPVLWKKLSAEDMEILVEGDPQMRRPFVVIEANRAKCPNANFDGARRLTDFLTGPNGQRAIANFQPDESGLLPAFYPIANTP